MEGESGRALMANLHTWRLCEDYTVSNGEVGPERSQMHILHLVQPWWPRGTTAWNTVVIPCSYASRVTKVEPSGNCASETALVPLLYESENAIKNCLTLLVSDLIFSYLKHICLKFNLYYTLFILYHIYYIIHIRSKGPEIIIYVGQQNVSKLWTLKFSWSSVNHSIWQHCFHTFECQRTFKLFHTYFLKTFWNWFVKFSTYKKDTDGGLVSFDSSWNAVLGK